MGKCIKTGLGLAVAGGALAAVVAMAPWPAAAQVGPGVCKCETATGKAQGKFAFEKAKCISKCEQLARAGSEPVGDCSAPYAGPTAACVQKAEGKAEATEQKSCPAGSCPSCYSSGDCTADSTSRTNNTEQQVDNLAPLVYCSPAPTDKGQQKCQDSQAKFGSKFAFLKASCYAKCRAAECKGKAAAGSCAPPASDPKTQACISKQFQKCVASVDKACTGNVPSCDPFANGTALCNAVESTVDSNDAGTYCASPSGAFTD